MWAWVGYNEKGNTSKKMEPVRAELGSSLPQHYSYSLGKFFWVVFGTGALTQILHLESLHQPFFVKGF
jgi:hypothetical protein